MPCRSIRRPSGVNYMTSFQEPLGKVQLNFVGNMRVIEDSDLLK